MQNIAQAIGLAVFVFLIGAMVVGYFTSPRRTESDVDPAVAAEVRHRIAAHRRENEHQRQRP